MLKMLLSFGFGAKKRKKGQKKAYLKKYLQKLFIYYY